MWLKWLDSFFFNASFSFSVFIWMIRNLSQMFSSHQEKHLFLSLFLPSWHTPARKTTTTPNLVDTYFSGLGVRLWLLGRGLILFATLQSSFFFLKSVVSCKGSKLPFKSRILLSLITGGPARIWGALKSVHGLTDLILNLCVPKTKAGGREGSI